MPAVIGLKHFRERLAFSQADLALIAGLNRDTIINIERGHVNPNFQTVRKLAKALSIQPHELLADFQSSRRR